MAWSSAALAAQELTDLAADKPLLGEIRSLASGAVSAARWVSGTTGTFAGADISDTTGIASRGYDGHPDLQTYPNTTGTGFAYLLDFGASGIELDAVAILNHALYSDTATTFAVQIADDSAFSTNLQTIATINPSAYLTSDARFALLTLDHTATAARRYSSVRYVRLQFAYGGASRPEFGEALFIRRRQLSYAPVRPLDYEHRRTVAPSHVSRSGKVHDYVLRKGQRLVGYEWQANSAEAAKLVALWDNSDEGSSRFVLIDKPNSAPEKVYLMRRMGDEFDIEAPFVEPYEQTITLEAEEVGPNYFAVYP